MVHQPPGQASGKPVPLKVSTNFPLALSARGHSLRPGLKLMPLPAARSRRRGRQPRRETRQCKTR